MITKFEAKTGHKVKAAFAPGGPAKDRVVKGEAFDVAVIASPYTDVVASGHVDKASETPLATLSVGVAVKKGAPKPDISNAEAVKRMMLSAKSLSYPNPAGGAASGVSAEETMKQLGILDQVKPKVTYGQGGGGALVAVAKGDIEVALAYMTEMGNPDVDIVGPLPRDISPPTGFVAFASAHPKDAAAAKALVQFLASPEAAAVYQAARMTPGK
jgi:molybdate transport system substrate-binding protein